MSEFWAWHTRTWVEHGAVNQTLHVGLGWYVIFFMVLTGIYLIGLWVER